MSHRVWSNLAVHCSEVLATLHILLLENGCPQSCVLFTEQHGIYMESVISNYQQETNLISLLQGYKGTDQTIKECILCQQP